MRVLSGPVEGTRHPNPYVKLLLHGLEDVVSLETFTWRRAIFGRYDILHLHWPEHLVNNTPSPLKAWTKTAVLGLIIFRAKLRHTKLVWTVHNETPHEQPKLASHVGFWLWQRYADGAIFLTESGRSSYPGRRPRATAVIRHGHYGPSIPDETDALPARRRPYLVTFGLIRRYKGLDNLVEATASTMADFDVVIAGPPPDQRYLDELHRRAGATPRVTVDARYLPQTELVPLIRQSAGVVLPYRRMNNSGALLLALTLGKRVLVPESPSNREISDLVGPGWIHYFRGAIEPSDLDDFYRRAVKAAAEKPAQPPDLSAFEWDDVIAGHEALYRKVAS